MATWLKLQEDGAGACAPAVTEREFRRYLECGILAHGFARARCVDCGHDFFVAYSCKCRGVCPSCTTRRMVETAAHLAIVVDGVFEAEAEGGAVFHPASGLDASAIGEV